MSDAPRWLGQLADGTLDEVREAEIAELVVTSGHLVACDPLIFLRGADPFARTVKPGTYSVLLGVLGEEVAYACLDLGNGKVDRWEVARCPDEEDVEGWPGYGVDSGVGCFVDLATTKAFLAREDAALESGSETEEDPLADIEPAIQKKRWSAVTLDSESGANLVAFKAGAGDGVYASFWGLNKAGKPLCLVTDFGILAEEGTAAADDLEDEDEDELDEDELGGDDLGELSGLEALAAALGARAQAEPETRQGPSPLFLQTRELLEMWIKTKKIELEEGVDRDAFAESLLEKLVSLAGQRHPGPHVADWLVDRREVVDVFATDEEIEADLKG